MNQDRKGFTLVELMIVVAVLSILAVMAFPRFANIVQKAQEGRTKGNLAAFRSALNIYFGDNEYWPYAPILQTMADGGGQIYPDWDFFVPGYLDDIPAVYTGQGEAWGGGHEGKNRICVAWAKNGSVNVIRDAVAGLAHPEDGYEYLYYICEFPTDATGGLEGHLWVNSDLLDSRDKKILTW
ncbi:MAG: type II secretion system protein [bacterium]